MYLYQRYVTDQFICSYNFDLVIPQYRILLYLSLSPPPAPSDRAFCAACQLSHTPDGITGNTLLTLCGDILLLTEAMRSGHKNFITYLFGPFTCHHSAVNNNNNNNSYCHCLCNNHVIRHVDPINLISALRHMAE